MIKNYFRIAWRNLRKNKIFSIINIAGLSIGVACFLLIALYVLDELRYDKYNQYADRIYRIDNHIKFGDFQYDGPLSSAMMGPTFSKDFPEIEHWTRFKNNGSLLVKKGEENFAEDKVAYADSSLFEVFSFPMIAGNPANALKEPRSVVITETIAKKYFSSTDVLGKTMVFNDSVLYKVTGIIKDIPHPSHFHFDFFLPLREQEDSRGDSWFNNNFYTYLVLKPGTDPVRFQEKLNKAARVYSAAEFKTKLNMSRDDFEKVGNYMRSSLMPLTKIHLYSNWKNELEANGSIQYVYIFSAIALFILLIACVNFMNLSTARSSNRAREVGLRKLFGSHKNQLISQFLSESILVSLLSFVLGIGIVLLALHGFNLLADKQISASVLLNPVILSGILLLIVIVGLIAGSYPAFFLSSFQPVEVLKGSIARGFKGSSLRNILVVFQFSVSIILVIGTIVIYNQLRYVRNKDIGYNKEQVLVIENTASVEERVKVLRDELLQLPGVKMATISGYLPVNGARSNQGFSVTPQFDNKNFLLMEIWNVDENYIPTLQIKIKEGRNFSGQMLTDSNAIVINETAARLLGTGSPLNKKFYRIDDLHGTKMTPFTVVGVIKNFNFNSLHEEVGPQLLTLAPSNGRIALRVNSDNMEGLLAQIKTLWNTMAPSKPFSYSFLDEAFNKQYLADQRTGNISIVFSALAIFIACLGLFGLAAFAAEQRVREIGIRKVLGAAIPDIVNMLSNGFVKLILLSVLIASPIAWWIMNRWLQDFAYRITISWWIFVVAGLLTLSIGLFTTIFLSIRAAVANPTKSLRAD